MSAQAVLFWVFALATVASAIGVILYKNPIASAMSLVACFFFLAGIYVLLWAHTIAVLQVMVYAGAIMVLFTFVIMLLNLQQDERTQTLSLSRAGGLLGCVALLGALFTAFRKLPAAPDWTQNAAQLQSFGTLGHLGKVLYTEWLFPFEAVSLLLLVAIVGAVVVAKPRI